MIHNISRFIAALALLATAQGVWADDHVSCRVIIQTPTNGTITVTRNDTHATVTSGDVLPEGTTVTVNATPADGYDLKELRLTTYTYGDAPVPGFPPGWVTDGASLISNGATFTIEENKEYNFIATFDQNVVKYSITKNITGQGTLDVTSESVAGNRISVGYTPGDGYRLESLTVTKADNSNVSVTYDAVKDKYYFTMPEANVTINAVFSATAFFVRFNANGGTGTMADQTIPVGETQALTANAFTREGYVFAGWSDTTDGSVVYANGQSVTNLAAAGETFNLYAQWTATYTVHFNANGGTGTMDDQTIAVGATTNLTANAFTRDGYVFAGWSDTADGNVVYTNGQSVTDLAAAGATKNLYAQWRETVTANYVDASGNAHTLSGCKEITPDHMPTTLSGNYIVSESVTYTSKVTISGNTTIILANGKTMSIGTEAAPLGGDYAIYASGTNSLTIYGQSLDAATAGRLEVYSTGYSAVKLYDGSYTQHSGNVVVSRSGGSNNNYAINAGGSVTIDGGKLDASITSEGSFAINASGNISISGGSVTANATGADSYGIKAKGNITLSWTRASDFVSFNSYNGTVNIKSGQTLYNGATAYSGNNVSLPSNETVTLRTFSSDYISVSGDEYTIKNTEGWNLFCDFLQDNDSWNRFSGKTVRLGDDITVTRMAGSQYHDFCGTFDGGGNTLTVNISSDDITDGSTQYVAPFRYVSTVSVNDVETPAAFRNLHVTGTITTDKQFTGGLIGGCWGTVSIDNCRVSTAITSTVSGDGTHGGIVGIQQSGALTITGCVFDGSLLGATTYAVGGFLGYRKSGAEIRNSLFAPAEVTVLNTSGATFARNKVDTYNSYYTYYLCDGTNYAPYDPADADHPNKYNNGHATRTVAPVADVTIEAVALTGTATQYTVSGITAYSGGGLQRGETLYYGSGDQLSLTLSNTATAAPQGYQYGYTASAGTLSGSTLTMPDQDVTISAALAPIDWATVNQGTSKDPYMIYNKDQLLLLAHRVNGTNGETANTYQGKYFKLGANITFDHDADEGDDYAENYEAIGGYIGGIYRYFKGDFDGANHTVSGIRIRKTGSGDADIYQGLFGQTSFGANIHDVHLTDARIKGCESVGGIVGYNNGGNIMRCTVTDSYITATGNSYYGTIFGWSRYATLTNNYYHGCTVNGTAVTSGKGCMGADIAANNGALPAYRLALGENITTPPGTFADQAEWLDTPPVSPRLAPGNGFTLAGNHYFASGYVFTPGSTLASGAAQGYTPRATLGGQLLDPYTPTFDADPLAGTAIAQFTVNADCDGKTLASTQAIYSTGQPVTVAYVNADGSAGEASAIALDGTETSLAAGTYFAGLENVNFDHTLNLTGNVTLILADGCTMNVGTSESRISGKGIKSYDEKQALTITGQSLGTGTLAVYTSGDNNHAISANNITINGGHVIAKTEGYNADAIWAYQAVLNPSSGNVTINGGTVEANASGDGADGIVADKDVTIHGGTVNATATGSSNAALGATGNVAINGGNVTATATNGIGINADDGDSNITLGWTNPADRITASSYSGTVQVADGKTLTDGTEASNGMNGYSGTLTDEQRTAIGGKTLHRAVTTSYVDASGTLHENVIAIPLSETEGVSYLTTYLQGLEVPVVFKRTFSAGKASTICLPFAMDNVSGGKVYSFAGITYDEKDGWVATMSETGGNNVTKTEANTPYVFMPDADGEVTFSGTTEKIPAAYDAKELSTVSGDWTFRGTYEQLKYGSNLDGHVYGFASRDKEVDGVNVAAGEFVKAKEGAGVKPMRCYLTYNKNNGEFVGARAVTRGIEENLPQSITVKFVSSTGNTTAIATLNTLTGEIITDDAWYTLSGTRLPGKPSQRGVYINKGRKVAINR